MFYSYDIPITMDIAVSNDAVSWTTVETGWVATTGDVWITHALAETTGRYIRLYETAFARTYGQCTDFQASTSTL